MTESLLPATTKTKSKTVKVTADDVVLHDSIEAGLAAISVEGLDELADIDGLLSEAKRRRHAETTRDTYDYIWSRFERWLANPAERNRTRNVPAYSLNAITDPNDPAQEALVLAYLTDLVAGPSDEAEFEEWLNDERPGSPKSPNTFNSLVAAIKARLGDHTGIEWAKSEAAKGTLAGLRRTLRENYGKDRRATPLLAHHVATMTTFLATERLPHVIRDLAIVEMNVAGLTAAEIARLSHFAVARPTTMMGSIVATTWEANVEYFEQTGNVAMRCLRVPGQVRKGGKQDPTRLVELPAHSPLTMAVLAQDDAIDGNRRVDWGYELGLDPLAEDDYFIYGFGEINRRQRIREVLIAAAKHAGHDWRPTRDEPCMPEAIAVDVRRSFAAQHGGEGSMTLADLRRAKRDQAALWIGLLAALRRSELLALTVADLGQVAGMHRYVIEIRKSKTDQEMKGVSLVVPGSETRPAHIDPVRCIQAWLDELTEIHGGDLPLDAPLFPGINRAGRPNAKAMTGQAWSERLRHLAELSGAITDPVALKQTSGHSLRRGFVTDAARRGQTAVQIQKVTRHTDLAALARYVGQLQAETGAALGVDELLDDAFTMIDPSIA